MTTHAQASSTPGGLPAAQKRMRKRDSIGVDKRKREDDSVSVAKITMIGTIGAALVTAVATLVVPAVTHNDGSNGVNPAGQTIKTTPPDQTTPGSHDNVAVNESGTEVTVTGSAEKDVDSVVVLIGPRESGGQYWAASANVVNQQWKLVVATEPHVLMPYEIKAYYRQQADGSAPIQGASFLISQGTTPTPTPPPPGPVVKCAEQHGDACFTGPGWGPPSVYRSDHSG